VPGTERILDPLRSETRTTLRQKGRTDFAVFFFLSRFISLRAFTPASTCLSPWRLEARGGQAQTWLGIPLWRCLTLRDTNLVVVLWWRWWVGGAVCLSVGVEVFGRRLSVCWSLIGCGIGLRTLRRLQAARMECCWMILRCHASITGRGSSCSVWRRSVRRWVLAKDHSHAGKNVLELESWGCFSVVQPRFAPGMVNCWPRPAPWST
jgi:hypothetical protein